MRPSFRHLSLISVITLLLSLLPTATVSARPVRADEPTVTTYTISGRVTDTEGNPVAGVTVTATPAKPPLIFIPGMAGSILKDPGKTLALWPNLLEPDATFVTAVQSLLGVVHVSAAQDILSRMTGEAEALRLSPDNNYATDLIAPDVIRWVVNTDAGKLVDTYGTLLEEFLPDQGYRPYHLSTGYLPVAKDGSCDLSQSSQRPDLFVFPYDWRLPIEETALRLAAYVACVRTIHPNTQIDILTHSMGSLVARRYILDQKDASYVRRLITMGAPWLGAPKMLNGLLTGDFDLRANLLLIHKDKLKELAATWPGAHELLPSKAYMLAVEEDGKDATPPFREDGGDVNGNNGSKEVYDHAALKSWLDTRYLQARPMTRNEAFHDNAGQDNWTGDSSGIEYHHIVGIAPGTIEQVIALQRCWLGLFNCTIVFTTKVDNSTGPAFWLMGDETVPWSSATGNSITPSGTSDRQHYYRFRDLKTSGSPIDTLQRSTRKYEHSKLPIDPKVQECIAKILASEICSTSLTAATAESMATASSGPDQYDILVIGAGSAVVNDAAGNLTGWVDDTAMLRNVVDVYYYDTGGDAVQIMALTSEPLTVTFRSSDTPLFVEIIKTSGDAIVEAVRYPDLVINPNTVLAVALPLTAAAPLSFDGSGDGFADTPVALTPIRASGPAAADTVPPTVTLTIAPDRVVTVNAEDTSGVQAVYLSFDGEGFIPYTAPILASAQAITVTAFADDTLGNRSAPQSAAIAQKSQLRLHLPSVIRVTPSAAVPAVPTYPLSPNVVPASMTTITPNAADYTVVTGADGRYTLDGLPAGTYTVTATLNGRVLSPAQRTVILPSGGLDVNFMIPPIISQVSASGSHTCTLTTGGGVKCWGHNDYGELGDGTTIHRYTPVAVNGLESGVAAISAGGGHTCALTTSGGVMCWGWNLYGQLGDSTTTPRLTPVDLSGLKSGVAAIAAGGGHTCALTTNGGVKCWGYNRYGVLGDGTVTHRHTPVDVSGLDSGVAAISTGDKHTCALTTSGGVKCWGGNWHGQLGDGTTTHRYTPVDVSGLESGVAAISAEGNHTCALTTSGGVKCWGGNWHGQLGDGTTTDRYTPVDLSELKSGVVAIAAGYYHTCALTTSGSVKCWGWNDYGQLGDGTTTHRSTPVDVSGLDSGVAAISSKHSHTCSLTTSGGLKCWGWNDYGQLGDGTNTHRYTPVDVMWTAD